MKSFKKILQYLKSYWLQVTLNIIFNIISILFSLFSLTMVVPFLRVLFNMQTQQILTNRPAFALNKDALTDTLNYYIYKIVTVYSKPEALLFICVFIVLMIFSKNLFRFLGIFYLAVIRNGVVKDIRNQIYKKILILPLAFFSEKRKGDLISRMSNDVLEIEWSILSSLEMLVKDPLTIIVFVMVLFFISPQLTLFALILLPIAGFLIAQIGKSLKRTSGKAQAKLGYIISIIEETIAGLRIIKAFNAIDITDKKFREFNNDYTRTAIRLYRKKDLASPLSEFLATSVVVAVVWFGGNLVLKGDNSLSADVFILYIAIFSQVIPPAKSVVSAFYNIQKGIASFERINMVFDAEEVIIEKSNPATVKTFNKIIEYKNVSFKYEDELVLKNINLQIEKGKTIAIVGHSGSGKSTLVDLLPRFYDCNEGEILIDGVPIKDLAIDDLRGLMGIVSQQTILFNDSVLNNIAFGQQNFTEPMVIEAAKIANANDFISQLPQGYHTNIGDLGCKLSGGERQRISIARAVLKNPPILILDEATSSLDSESEHIVQEAILNLMKNRTSIIIAHRLSTIMSADTIFVLNNGEIVEKGNHNQLIQLNGHYKKLYDIQMFS